MHGNIAKGRVEGRARVNDVIGKECLGGRVVGESDEGKERNFRFPWQSPWGKGWEWEKAEFVCKNDVYRNSVGINAITER